MRKGDYEEISESGNALLGTMRATILAQLELHYEKQEKMIVTLESTMNSVRKCENWVPDELIEETKKIKTTLEKLKAETDCALDRLSNMWSKENLSLVPTPVSAEILDKYAKRKDMSRLYDRPMSSEEFNEVVDNDSTLAIKSMINESKDKKRKRKKKDKNYCLTDEESELLDEALKGSE